jgi:hypothetical protein
MGNSACLAWFTAARDQPQVKIAFSDDGGLNFDPPIRIDDGMPMGRVDAAMLDRNTALVSWMETIPGGAQIRLATVDRTSGEVSSLQVADVPGGRSTGFPQLEVGNKQIFLAWNVSGETGKRIRSVRLDLEQIYP